MSFEEILRKGCGPLPYERLEIVQFHRFNLSAVERGVLFVLAEWSGPARSLFTSLCRLAAEAPTVIFRILVVNADEYDQEEFRATFGEILHGTGESFWIKDGAVVYFHKGAKEMDAMKVIEEKIAELGKW